MRNVRRTLLLLFGGVGFGIALVAVLGIVTYVLHAADSAPALNTLHPRVSGGSSQVYAADGTRLGFIQSDELRTPVGSSEIPAELKHATVAIEDQRFYSNNGVDFTGIVRSAFKDLSSGSALQGGSTITMQLMRNLYLGGDQHSLHQKIVEASRNAALLATYASFAGRIRRIRYSANFARKRERWGEAMREHEAILEALRRRAGSELADILFAHLRNKRAAAVEHLAQAGAPASNDA